MDENSESVLDLRKEIESLQKIISAQSQVIQKYEKIDQKWSATHECDQRLLTSLRGHGHFLTLGTNGFFPAQF